MKRVCGYVLGLIAVFAVMLSMETVSAAEGAKVFRIGIIGTTTSHVPAALKAFNTDGAKFEIFKGFKVTAAYTGGMPDNSSSWDRRDKYTQECIDKGVKIYGTIEEMVQNVDGVMLESVDGRPHLEQAKPVIAAKKPLFIDKPMAGSLADVLEIFNLAAAAKVPVFSASSLRYSAEAQQMRNEAPLGKIWGADAASPASLNDKHPDMYWYGIHGVETLFTLMGPDCVSVSRVKTQAGDLAVGIWNDGRIGTFRGTRAGRHTYAGFVYCEKGNQSAGKYDGYEPLFVEICKFFKTGKAPVAANETINIFAFMSASDVSWAKGGKLVPLQDVITHAKNEKQETFEVVLAKDGKPTWNGQAATCEQLTANVAKVCSNGTVCRVIVNNRAGAPFDALQKVLLALDQAYLANYLY